MVLSAAPLPDIGSLGARQWAGDRAAADRRGIADSFRDLAGRQGHRPDRRERAGGGRASPLGGVEAPAGPGVADHVAAPGGPLLRTRRGYLTAPGERRDSPASRALDALV